MSELFDEEEAKEEPEGELAGVDGIKLDVSQSSFSDARRRLENLLDEKRLRDELEDFLDY